MTDIPGRVLLIDDDDVLREIMKAALEEKGNVEVMACADGDQAVLGVTGFNPGLILLDLRMPGKKDGLDTLKLLRRRKELSKVPVIFVTGAVKVEMEDQYRRLGVIGVIHKPFTTSVLKDSISKLWADHQMVKK